MYSINDLKKEVLVEIDNTPYKILEVQHVSLGRGGAVLRTKIKNLLNGNVLDKTFRPADKIIPAYIERIPSQYLYQKDERMIFMNVETYEQEEVVKNVIAETADYLTEGANCTVLKFKNDIIGIDLPNTIEIKVTHCEPGIKGNSVTTSLKPCTLETGKQINVPIFINEGDVVRVDTRTGQYLERQK